MTLASARLWFVESANGHHLIWSLRGHPDLSDHTDKISDGSGKAEVFQNDCAKFEAFLLQHSPDSENGSVVLGIGTRSRHRTRFLPPFFLEKTKFLVNSPRPNAILRVIARALVHCGNPLVKPCWWPLFIQLNVLFRCGETCGEPHFAPDRGRTPFLGPHR